MQEKKYNSKRNKVNSRHIFSSNIKFLFKLNREQNYQKKVDFSRETLIKRAAIYKWEREITIPIESNLDKIIKYFNKWLNLDLYSDELISINLEEVVKKGVKENNSGYLTEVERLIIEKFRRFPKHKQDTLFNLIKDFE